MMFLIHKTRTSGTRLPLAQHTALPQGEMMEFARANQRQTAAQGAKATTRADVMLANGAARNRRHAQSRLSANVRQTRIEQGALGGAQRQAMALGGVASLIQEPPQAEQTHEQRTRLQTLGAAMRELEGLFVDASPSPRSQPIGEWRIRNGRLVRSGALNRRRPLARRRPAPERSQEEQGGVADGELGWLIVNEDASLLLDGLGWHSAGVAIPASAPTRPIVEGSAMR
ncbi:hypothetical protein [Magnetofaba australis]|uniref:hypothetical protein n=1 Tax=Magnetofaba australis TaxID=1472297 RepID=UPI000A19BEA1|nr:hypothetical protein [Magnetofaba australis]